MNDQRKGLRHCAPDFQAIHQYRHIVNQKILDAIRAGVFTKANNLDDIPNLMETEEKEVFQLNLPNKPNSAMAGQRDIGVYYHNDPKSKSIMLTDADHFMA